MKKSLIYLVVFVAIIFLGSCTKAYNSNPNSAANNSANPLNNTLLSFNWSGTAPMSAVITNTDGSVTNWVADAGSMVYNYVGGYNILSGNMGGKKIVGIWLTGSYPNCKYAMGWKNGSQYVEYADSNSVPSAYRYWTYNAPLNSGGMYVIKSDTFLVGTPGYLAGLFYGEAKDSEGRTVNIQNGYFNFRKW